MKLKGKYERTLQHYLDSKSTLISIEAFLQDYASGMPTRFSHKQIKKYSNNFSHKLGQRGFGSVFKAKLPNNCIVAVKILDETEQSEVQFMNEVQTMGKIHQQNLVCIMGFCFEQSRRALIYEFMENGSLDKYMHCNIKEGLQRLSWNQFNEIAVGSASGIAYLHEECRSRILHCYAPPEMWWNNYGPVTEKSDVYSFGMVVLEMDGERRNYDRNMSKSSEMYFLEWAYLHLVVQASDVIGSSKWHTCEREQEENIARRMELVGLWCIQYTPSRWPSTRNVIEMLKGYVSIDIPPLPFNANVLHPAGFRDNQIDACDVS
ncbi:LEAF RUST 10 DISEASE-RESISTANCE LOCUS RECEPTOR-LIKE PROTEIN KINASE-like protein 2.7 isoform X2 [Cinnamomum micranthum f. kanehirae]|uniref:LEAF RUST 10 DISEASE-RESISTANCE LOCUS RECEPTOR-LIKE PROTEIN KINASE-like protein 2.7 isoform X2 n=1 Tax=Cinnamomum micranthum f. kanehirae TaxID=337451 RepID=A0A443P1T7_9MAGN|nr:LEAF RUST 10 DISEASE-RESISTANCE LOCUS RECEPTOR-LIKE PROTEIN KINASE-like protein 2.7 isoform X2 [Cinnamomum micranthum f. kanehirae]